MTITLDSQPRICACPTLSTLSLAPPIPQPRQSLIVADNTPAQLSLACGTRGSPIWCTHTHRSVLKLAFTRMCVRACVRAHISEHCVLCACVSITHWYTGTHTPFSLAKTPYQKQCRTSARYERPPTNATDFHQPEQRHQQQQWQCVYQRVEFIT